MHFIWTLPPLEDDFSLRWNKIKGLFTRKLKSRGIVVRENHRNEYNVWQKRFWEHVIKYQTDMNNHVDYIHYNPVKHRLMQSAKEWPYSSFHIHVKRNVISLD